MWALGLLTSQPARRYFMLAGGALVAVATVLLIQWRMELLEVQRDAALVRAQQAENRAQMLTSALERMRAAEQARASQQQQIEGKRDARRKRNSATLAKPENAEVADIVLPDDMLDGLREQ